MVSQFSRGTQSYRAPELIAESIYTRKVDIWALGCIFYEIVTGQKMFKSDWHVNDYRISRTVLIIPDIDFHYHYSEQFFLQTIRDTLNIDWNERPNAKTLIQTFLDFMEETASGPAQSFLFLQSRVAVSHNTRSIEPTYHGYLATYSDVLLILEATRNNKILRKVVRRPRLQELDRLIKSGNIFVFDKESSGIRRWIDGVHWSKSVEFGHCLVYHELEKPDEKNRVKKRPRSTQMHKNKRSRSTSSISGKNDQERDLERWSSGEDSPLSQNFKVGGLIKKMMSVEFEDANHCLIMYFTIDDTLLHRLPSPSNDPRLAELVVGNDLTSKFSVELESEASDLETSPSEAMLAHLRKPQILTRRELFYRDPATEPMHPLREVQFRRSLSPNYPLSSDL